MAEGHVADFLDALHPDPWRSEVGFAPEIASANAQLFEHGIGEVEAVRVLNDWLQKYQPCLFGRIGAKVGLMSYCILTETDLRGSDEAISDKIQMARSQ